MTKTRKQLRDLIREEIHDIIRIGGNATGGSIITLTDTVNLTQADDYWNGQWLHIINTYDAINPAPQGESRKIADFDNVTATLTVEKAFSAAIDEFDLYIIPDFDHTERL